MLLQQRLPPTCTSNTDTHTKQSPPSYEAQGTSLYTISWSAGRKYSNHLSAVQILYLWQKWAWEERLDQHQHNSRIIIKRENVRFQQQHHHHTLVIISHHDFPWPRHSYLSNFVNVKIMKAQVCESAPPSDLIHTLLAWKGCHKLLLLPFPLCTLFPFKRQWHRHIPKLDKVCGIWLLWRHVGAQCSHMYRKSPRTYPPSALHRGTDEVDRLRYKTSCCGDTVIVS